VPRRLAAGSFLMLARPIFTKAIGNKIYPFTRLA